MHLKVALMHIKVAPNKGKGYSRLKLIQRLRIIFKVFKVTFRGNFNLSIFPTFGYPVF